MTYTTFIILVLLGLCALEGVIRLGYYIADRIRGIR